MDGLVARLPRMLSDRESLMTGSRGHSESEKESRNPSKRGTPLIRWGHTVVPPVATEDAPFSAPASTRPSVHCNHRRKQIEEDKSRSTEWRPCVAGSRFILKDLNSAQIEHCRKQEIDLSHVSSVCWACVCWRRRERKRTCMCSAAVAQRWFYVPDCKALIRTLVCPYNQSQVQRRNGEAKGKGPECNHSQTQRCSS